MEEKKRYNEVTCFMWYVFNKWTREEAVLVFGSLGDHIFNKWVHCREHHLGDLYWYSELDDTCRQKLVDRACSIYNG